MNIQKGYILTTTCWEGSSGRSVKEIQVGLTSNEVAMHLAFLENFKLEGLGGKPYDAVALKEVFEKSALEFPVATKIAAEKYDRENSHTEFTYAFLQNLLRHQLFIGAFPVFVRARVLYCPCDTIDVTAEFAKTW